MKALPQKQAVTELLFATLFWGFGYIATVWALEMASAIEVTFLRFFLGGLFGLLFIQKYNVSRKLFSDLVKRSFFPGFFMAVLLLSQTWGLKYTTAVNSTFITALYVVITPLMEWVILRKGSRGIFILYALVSLAGVGLILKGSFDASAVLAGRPDSWKGDLLTLVTAFASAGHLIYVGLIWSRVHRPFLFNSLQSLWAAALLLPFLLGELYANFGPSGLGASSVSLFSPLSQVSIESVLGLLSLVFGSTVLAFFLQLRAQSVLSPSLTSLICLLESPLALVFSLFFLNEAIGPWALAGAAVIFISAFGATLSESKIKSEEGPADIIS